MAKKKTPLEVELLWGLPGSGKTTYVKDDKRTKIDLDVMVRNYDRLSKQYGTDYFLGVMASEIANHFSYNRSSLVIDGLITTNAFALKILEMLRTGPALKAVETAVFRITYWKEDRQACLWNDQGRRLLASDQTILNMPFEIPDPEILKIPAENITARDVVRKSSWVHYLNESDIYTEDGNLLKGQRWITGGSWGDYQGNSGHTDPDPPREFEELDAFLEKIAPNLSFLQYKRIFRDCCTQQTSYDSGYYGGGTNYLHWECDLQKLYSVLAEMRLLPVTCVK